LPDQQLASFFAQLEALWPQVGCAHDLRSAESVAKGLGLTEVEIDALFDWCNDHGGYCDCEVSANTREFWESNRART
jgi:hypothetical protein